MSSQKIALSSIQQALPSSTDVFICSASFEERSKVIPLQLSTEPIEHALICYNKVGYTDLIERTARELKSRFGDRSRLVELSVDNPLIIADHLQRSIPDIADRASATYVVDITSFTHEALLILLKVLQTRVKSSDRVIGLYNSASQYSVDANNGDMWLTKGVTEIRSVLGYPGQIMPTQKLHLIVLVGFETERAERVIEAYEPTKLSLGYGSPVDSISQPLHEINRKFHKKLCDKYKSVFEFTTSLIDPIEAKKTIEKQAALLPGFNVFVAPMNTKISTVGVALAAFENEALQICYASAEQYNFLAYSKPSSDCYFFEIPVLHPVVA